MKKNAGFTLIELLVVIAIIAILAAVLLPVLAQAKARGANVRCINNLKQLGVANRMYTDDANDYMAYPNWDSGNAGAPQGWLYTCQSGGTDPIPNPIDPGPYQGRAVSAHETGSWFKYSGNPNVYLCPVDIQSPTYSQLTGSESGPGRPNKLSSYVMNGAVVGYPGSGFGSPCKITSAWTPMCYLLWEPNENAGGKGNPGWFEFNDGSNFPSTPGSTPAGNEGIGLQHSKHGGNALALDGHVDFVTSVKFNQYSASAIKSLLWWNPYTGNGHQ